jgi:hypothetical protein
VTLDAADRVYAARASRIVAAGVSILSTVALIANAILGARLAGADRHIAWSSGLWLVMALVVPALLFVGARWALRRRRARALRGVLAGQGELHARLVHLLRSSDPAMGIARARRIEAASIGVPLVAIAFTVPACIACLIHAGSRPDDPFFFAYTLFQSVPPVIVGSALAYRFARDLAQRPIAEWDTRKGELGAVVGIGAAAVPLGCIALLIPPILAVITAAVTVPLAYRCARAKLASERRALGVA